MRKHFCLLRQPPLNVPLYACRGGFLVCVRFSTSAVCRKILFRHTGASAFTDARFSVYCLSNLMSNRLSRYFVCKRYAKICGCAFGRKTAQILKMSFTITKKAMMHQDELHNLPRWVMSFCRMRCKI